MVIKVLCPLREFFVWCGLELGWSVKMKAGRTPKLLGANPSMVQSPRDLEAFLSEVSRSF